MAAYGPIPSFLVFSDFKVQPCCQQLDFLFPSKVYLQDNFISAFFSHKPDNLSDNNFCELGKACIFPCSCQMFNMVKNSDHGTLVTYNHVGLHLALVHVKTTKDLKLWVANQTRLAYVNLNTTKMRICIKYKTHITFHYIFNI